MLYSVFNFAVLYEIYQHREGGHCWFSEVATEPNQRLCEKGEPESL